METYLGGLVALHGRLTCFQFVKRMNGNPTVFEQLAGKNTVSLLPIREAYEWKPTLGLKGLVDIGLMSTCFQFVKRMNGNLRNRIFKLGDSPRALLPIREAYEWK